MKIITNNQPRLTINGFDLTAAERKEFDYLAEEELGAETFFRFKEQVYALSSFVVTRKDGEHKEWDGIFGQNAFQAVCIKLVDDGEKVIVGQMFC